MFEWQKGYGAFAVCGRERALIRKYIHNQEAHHQNETFKREYVRLLEENEVSYEEQFLW
jgi:hypothetical protein